MNRTDSTPIDASHLQRVADLAWARVQDKLRAELGEDVWRHWLKGLEFAGCIDGTVYLSHPSEVTVKRVTRQYADRLRLHWLAEYPAAREVRIGKKSKLHNMGESHPVHAESLAPPPCANSQGAEADLLFDKKDLPLSVTASADQAASGEASNSTRPVYANSDDHGGGFLDPRMTFANFIVGKPNELAMVAAKHAADDAVKFTSLFIHGGVGLGKTHLLQAIAWHIHGKNDGRSIVYLSAERFMNHFLQAMRRKDTPSFRDKFRSRDVLIIDDLQFISGKEATQVEFYHTYNDLLSQQRQVILAADRPPADLLGLGNRMQSRLNNGMVVAVGPTDLPLRLAILKARAEWEGVELSVTLLQYLAQKITGNVRELEGALNRISAHINLLGGEVTIDKANEILADLIRANNKKITIGDIQREVARHYGIKVSDLQSKRRAQAIVRPRHIAMYLAKNLTRCSYPEIGRMFDGRDHTTVMHAVRQIEKGVKADGGLAEDIALLKGVLAKNG